MAEILLEGLAPEEVAHIIPHRPILVCWRGSIAHGTHISPEDPSGIDDKDIIAVYIPDLEHYFGTGGVERGKDIKLREWDCAAYELRHMVKLLCNGNPNVLATLWTSPIYEDREGKLLRENRSLFVTKKAYNSFGGYAYGQLKRMTSFKDVESACGCLGKFHEPACEVAQERGRGSTKRFATGFMGEKRKALVAKHGYDTKNAAHLLRLLRMGVEFLRTGQIVVDRTGIDADYLKDVKRGFYPLPVVQSEAERLFEEMRLAKEESNLPEEPDEGAVNRLLVALLSLSFMTRVALEGSRAIGR